MHLQLAKCRTKNLKPKIPWGWRMARWLRVHVLLQKAHIWFPAPTVGGSQVPVTPGLRDQMPLVLQVPLPPPLYKEPKINHKNEKTKTLE